MLIVFEGLDGSGKTTLAGAVAEDLEGRQWDVARFAFPSKGPIGKLVRECFAGKQQISPVAYQHLMVADALDCENRIRQQLDSHRTVIVDRHPTISGMVYQVETYNLNVVMSTNVPYMFTPPSLVVLVDIPADEAMRRINARGGADSRYESASLSTMHERRSRYVACMTLLPYRYIMVNGEDTVGENVDKVVDAVRKLSLKIN